MFDLIVEQAASKELPINNQLPSSYAIASALIERLNDDAEAMIQRDSDLSNTEKEQVIRARKGQGVFRKNVERIEKKCRITGIANPRLLIASHIKPWRSCDSSKERLDENNGFLLAPHVDRLFDRGLISFSDAGDGLISPALKLGDVTKLGLESKLSQNVGHFTDGQKSYLKYHRNQIFLP